MLAATVGLVSTQATAATLNVDGTGQLIGATGVDVGGTLYDVAFVEGTCVSLFSGCDAVSDFTFQSRADQASQALMDQVFLDIGAVSFDSNPSFTFGCTIVDQCAAHTPYDLVLADRAPLKISIANNRAVEGSDAVASVSSGPTVDTAPNPSTVFALWTPSSVPEPSIAVLLGLGFAGMSSMRRSDRRAL